MVRLVTPGSLALGASLRAWPGLAARDADHPPTLPEIAAFVRASGSTFRVVPAQDGVAYEDAVAAGTIPTREGSWHDALNALVFVRFGGAKAALHRRVLALRRARLASEPGTRGRRSREEDALTLVDECALLVGGSAAALASLHDARQRRDLHAVDEVIRAEGLHVACFGHALLEHLVFGRPPIGAGLVPLVVDEPGDAALDCVLTRAIEAGTFDAPRLSPTVPWPDPIVDAWFSEAARDQPGAASPRTCSTGSAGSSR